MIYYLQDAYLVFLLKQFSELTSIIIFVSTKEDCETVHVMLQDLEFSTSHLHSFMRQDQRNRTLNQIKSGTISGVMSFWVLLLCHQECIMLS